MGTKQHIRRGRRAEKSGTRRRLEYRVYQSTKVVAGEAGGLNRLWHRSDLASEKATRGIYYTTLFFRFYFR